MTFWNGPAVRQALNFKILENLVERVKCLLWGNTAVYTRTHRPEPSLTERVESAVRIATMPDVLFFGSSER